MRSVNPRNPRASVPVRSVLRLLIVCVAALGLLGGCYFSPSVPTRIQPGQNFPDPGILATTGGYYRYSTNAYGMNVPMSHATSPTGAWSWPVDAFPNPPSWVLGHIWGPDVVKIDNYYYLYYSAAIAWDGSAFGEHAIGVARSTSPAGPFTAVGPQPLYRDPQHRGVIDPEVVGGLAGERYLLWSVDWGPGGFGSSVNRSIQSQRLASPTSRTGSIGTLLTANRNTWENGVVEAPTMVSAGGNFYLFYSGGLFSQNYATGYAYCGGSPLNACLRYPNDDTPVVFTGWNGLTNPGGVDMVPFYYGVWLAIGHVQVGANREPYVSYVTWTGP
ncbi:MAG: family 43 glycosylhydrolase [Myxococcales bacterium]|nr:family 43 glycosylhydrolase [Myxococcales bacterium]